MATTTCGSLQRTQEREWRIINLTALLKKKIEKYRLNKLAKILKRMPENKIPKLFGSCQERPTES
jgi:hypothetical protein